MKTYKIAIQGVTGNTVQSSHHKPRGAKLADSRHVSQRGILNKLNSCKNTSPWLVGKLFCLLFMLPSLLIRAPLLKVAVSVFAFSQSFQCLIVLFCVIKCFLFKLKGLLFGITNTFAEEFACRGSVCIVLSFDRGFAALTLQSYCNEFANYSYIALLNLYKFTCRYTQK